MAADRRLFLQLHRASRVVVAYVNRRTIDVLGVSAAQLGTLYHVAKNPQCSATDIADVLDLNKSAVSSMLQRLERAQLVGRESDPSDGRGSRLTVTERGEAVRARSMALTRKLMAEMTEGFDEREVDVVARFLSSLIERCRRDENG